MDAMIAAPTRPAPTRHARGGRFLDGQGDVYDRYIRAAEGYVANVGASLGRWLYVKPYGREPGNVGYFDHMYGVMNLLRAMQVPDGGRVLEVGSGPGWLSEILACLGYEVVGLEPCPAMIRVARDRVASCLRRHRINEPPRVEFLLGTLEECALADESVDAVLFHEALHHVVDERAGLAHCLRVLRPGGVLGVTGEAAWLPGRSDDLEASCREEMARYGTLENPYDPAYLDDLLHRVGFREVVRYHGINGYFPDRLGGRTLAEAAQSPAWANNHLTACKPASDDPTTADPGVVGHAEVRVLAADLDRETGRARLTVWLRNSGASTWLSRAHSEGRVTIGLTQGDPITGAGSREALGRLPLPRPIRPGERVALGLEFRLAPPFDGPWRVEPVCEDRYWFRAYGTVPAEVRF